MTTPSAPSSSRGAAPAFCLACGHNLAAELAVAIGPLELEPAGEARWRGQAIPLTCAQFLLLAALIQARGKLVSKDVLAERVGYDGAGDAHDVVQVLACRVRQALRGLGCPPAIIRTTRGRGYALDVALLDKLATEGARSC